MTQDFTLKIILGNDAMQTREDVARALRAVAKKLDSGLEFGTIKDVNGNSVGDWSGDFESDENDDEQSA